MSTISNTYLAMRDALEEQRRLRSEFNAEVRHAQLGAHGNNSHVQLEGNFIEFNTAPVIHNPRSAVRITAESSWDEIVADCERELHEPPVNTVEYSAMSWDEFCEATAGMTTEELLEQVRIARSARG